MKFNSRISLFLAPMAILLFLILLSGRSRAAFPPNNSPATHDDRETRVTTTEDGRTHWTINAEGGCHPADRHYELKIDEEPTNLYDIEYSMTNFDVDHMDPQDCTGGGEIDVFKINGNDIGILTGANNSYSINSWPIQSSKLVSGTNQIEVDVDSTGTGCWCVGVGIVELSARTHFNVSSHTPDSEDRNWPFQADRVNLTVTFTRPYDQETIDDESFRLEYLDINGQYQEVQGDFTFLAPRQFRFVPSRDLLDGVRYRVTVIGGSGGVRDSRGNTMPDNVVWHFWTAPDLSITDDFDYGSGSTCPPSLSPCSAIEIAVFQTARNFNLISGKPALARVYVRWKMHENVNPSDQLTELDVRATLNVGNDEFQVDKKIKRRDHYSPEEIEDAEHTINFPHTPSSTPGDYNYSVEIIPLPQSDPTYPVKYHSSRTLPQYDHIPTLAFPHYFLRIGSWSSEVPPQDRRKVLNLMSAGALSITSQFPVFSTWVLPQGEHSQFYSVVGTLPLDREFCASGNLVQCPGSSVPIPEYSCIFDRFRTMRGGNPFVIVSVPQAICGRPTAHFTSYTNEVIIHQNDRQANGETIAHEAGHALDISLANDPDLEHRNDSAGLEGFDVFNGINHSIVENRSHSISLMHKEIHPTGTWWIHNLDYGVLMLSRFPLSPALMALDAGPYWIASGWYEPSTGSATLTSAFLQEVPNDPPDTSGDCQADLLDNGDNLLSRSYFTPQPAIFGVEEDLLPFSVSLPWNTATQKLRITCNGSLTLTLTRTNSAPTVAFNGIVNGEVLSGSRLISWTGSDADGPRIDYQLQRSHDGGANWTPITPLLPSNSFTLDTSLLPSGSLALRIMATDGFNTVYDSRQVTITNNLKVIAVSPAANATDVHFNATLSVHFGTDIDQDVLESRFSLTRLGSNVPGKLSYISENKQLFFDPSEPLLPNTTYRAMLVDDLQDIHGNILGVTYIWDFTTAPDSKSPTVTKVYPTKGELDVPLNALVQVRLSEPMDPAQVTAESLTLSSSSGPVPGSFSYAADQQSILFISSSSLSPDTTYTASLNPSITDLAGNHLVETFQWSFTTGKSNAPEEFRILGNYQDTPVDSDGDGLYDQLKIAVDVEVLVEQEYSLNGKLTDLDGNFLGWAEVYRRLLQPGVHTLDLVFDSKLIRSNGANGPYHLGSINLEPHWAAEWPHDWDQKGYLTYPYDVTSFYAPLMLEALPNQLLEVNTTRSNAFNLHDFSSHISLPDDQITFSLFGIANTSSGVSLDAAGNVNIHPAADTAVESEILIEAKDSLGNRAFSFFNVSVQESAPSRLTIDGPESVTVGGSATFRIHVFDQWDRPYTEPVTVSLDSTLGSMNPETIQTARGEANGSFYAGGKPGTTFIVARVGEVEQFIEVKMEGALSTFLPVITK